MNKYRRKTVDKYVLDAWRIAAVTLFILLSIVMLQPPKNEAKADFLSPLAEPVVEEAAWVEETKPEPSPLPTGWEKNVGIIVKEFAPFGKKAVLEALLVSWQESKWESNAAHRNKNGTVDKGLWQLNSRYHTNSKCSFNPECSTKKAVKLYEKNGWGAWYGRGILKIFKD